MEITATVPAEGYKDRSTGLLLFGVLQLIAGVMCALFIPLMIAGQAMSANVTGGETNFRMVIPGVVTYLLFAVTFIWIGGGSMKARRWARALSLIIGWFWLIVGIIVSVFSGFLMHKTLSQVMQKQGTPAGIVWVPLIIVLGIFSVIFVILPGLLVYFYGSKHVKATCEVRDPVRRWTDEAPLPVIALALMLGFGAVSMLLMPIAYGGVMPVFGKLITGIPGTVLTLAIAALWAFCAWMIYKLNPIGWWIIFVSMAAFGISGFITFQTVPMTELYSTMGYPAAQIEQMEQFSGMMNQFMSYWMVGAMVPLFAFLFFVKRYFAKTPAEIAA